MFRGVRHRVAQFFGALRPHIDAADRAEAYRYLDEAQRAVFESMMLRDQQHCIEVFERVRAAAGEDRALLVAALLHDCGKGRVALWERVAHVLLRRAPGLRHRLAREHGAEWRRAMWRLEHHPVLGADMVARAQAVSAGASGDADAEADVDIVRWIREQESKTPDVRLAILQAADEA